MEPGDSNTIKKPLQFRRDILDRISIGFTYIQIDLNITDVASHRQYVLDSPEINIW